MYLFNSATSNYTVTKTKEGLIRLRNPKNRHAVEEADRLLRRNPGLYFEVQQGIVEDVNPLDSIVKKVKKSDVLLPENDESPSPFFKKDNDAGY